MNKWKIRSYQYSDKEFITSTWLRSNRDNSKIAKSIPKSVYFTETDKLINKILDESRIIVACNPKDPAHIFGYLVYQPLDNDTVIHYLYVKKAFRGYGIAKAMFAEFTPTQKVFYTHEPKNLDLLIRYQTAIFNPFLFWSN